MYFAGLGDADVESVMGTGVCVKTCPTATDVVNEAWWKANCKDNSAMKCATMTTDTTRQYSSEK